MTGAAIEPRTKGDFDHLAELGNMLQASGFFKDTKSVAQAAVKVQAGRELGLGPVEAMRAFHIVEGKVEMSADLLASLVKSSEKYDYTVLELTREVCRIQFYEDDLGEIGVSEFSMEDARGAGMASKDVWKKYPRNMLFARAMSNGVAWYCPDLTMGGRIFVEGEVGGEEVAPSLSVVEVEEVAEVQRAEGEPLVVDLVTGEVVEEPEAEPEAEPGASNAQKAKLMLLAGELGYDDDRRHAEAGVASFKDLTKTAASRLIEAWGELAEAGETDAPEAEPDPETSTGSASPGPAAVPNEEAPASPEQWTRLLARYKNKRSVLSAAKRVIGVEVTAESLTVDQAAQVLEEAG